MKARPALQKQPLPSFSRVEMEGARVRPAAGGQVVVQQAAEDWRGATPQNLCRSEQKKTRFAC